MTRRGLFAIILASPALLAQRRGRTQGPKPNGAGGSTSEEMLLRFPGTLKSISKKEILLEVEGEQQLIFRRIKKTRFLDGEKEAKETDAPAGQAIVIEGRRELNGDLDAYNVRWNEKQPHPQ